MHIKSEKKKRKSKLNHKTVKGTRCTLEALKNI